MKGLLALSRQIPEFAACADVVPGRCTLLTGLSHIHKALFTAGLARGPHPVVLLCSDEAECSRFEEELTALGLRALFYPARDLTLRPVESTSREFERRRVGVLRTLLQNPPDVLLTTPDAAMLYTVSPEQLRKSCHRLTPGMPLSTEQACAALIGAGYARIDPIDSPGQFAVRGGIVDFFPPDASSPVRIERWGDDIDTITSFDVETQRRTEVLEEAWIVPATELTGIDPQTLAERIEQHAASLRGKTAATARARLQADAARLREGRGLPSADAYSPLMYPSPATLFDYFDRATVVLSDPARIKERVRAFCWQLGQDVQGLLEEGVLCRGLTEFALEPDQFWDIIVASGAVLTDAFTRTSIDLPLREMQSVTAKQLSLWGGGLDVLLEDLAPLLEQRYRIVVLAGTERAARSLAEDLAARKLPASFCTDFDELPPGRITVCEGGLSAGFEFPAQKLAVISHGRVSAAKPRRRRHKGGTAIASLSELTPGDYVVHITHGIGIYEGIHKLEVSGIVKDYIKIRYDKGDLLYVPVTQMDLVSKYIGSREDSTVRLHRLGGGEWQKTRARVRKAVADMAKELIELYAERMRIEGTACAPDTDWQNDFEHRFPYDETEDQLRCIDEIKADMERQAPMDRLLCGDVGFGKTEVALRAAFKCIDNGGQCALLVPTTILAWQHYQTILSRFEGFPIRAEVLSRYRTPKQQEAIVQKLRRGEIDLIVGTHRLISKDIQFRKLGLFIVDEEQRFGVAQKEKLKEATRGVDCLTLSATPIPRTLNMAMSGIRDMSVLEEAPQDRRPVQTYVLEHDNGVIDDAILRELRRGGQVYYLHNRVETIEETAIKLHNRIPDARIAVAHGKMSEDQLSEVWRQLLEQEVDVLVCTTIIETGVDVSNVNTLIIENADRMGLSQLHQLRGRVGRSSRRAFAYLTFVRGKTLSEIAEKRLTAIREFTEFGAGFKIAMRDLELRGAGNILGAQQHGHMEAVGYDMYLKMLNEAVCEQKGEAPPKREEECLVDLQVPAHIPESYIENARQRLYVYRRIADVRTREDAWDVLDELIDRFGDVPPAVEGLVTVGLLRSTAAQRGITEISQKNGSLLLFMRQLDVEYASGLAGRLRGRVMLSAGSKPYVQVKIAAGQSGVDCLSEVLETRL